METTERVKCNMCEWQGGEDDLKLIGIDEQEQPIVIQHDHSIERHQWGKEPVEYIKGCPNCLTDGYLMDK